MPASVIERSIVKFSPSLPDKVIPEYAGSFLLIPVLVSLFTVIFTFGLSVDGSSPSTGSVYPPVIFNTFITTPTCLVSTT